MLGGNKGASMVIAVISVVVVVVSEVRGGHQHQLGWPWSLWLAVNRVVGCGSRHDQPLAGWLAVVIVIICHGHCAWPSLAG